MYFRRPQLIFSQFLLNFSFVTSRSDLLKVMEICLQAQNFSFTTSSEKPQEFGVFSMEINP